MFFRLRFVGIATFLWFHEENFIQNLKVSISTATNNQFPSYLFTLIIDYY